MDSVFFRYANALFELAKESSDVINYQKSIRQIDFIFDESPDYIKLLDSYFVSKKEKIDCVDEIFKSHFDATIINFIKVLVINHRIAYYQSIFKEFNSLCNAFQGIEEGTIYSTIPLDKEKIHQIELSIESRNHKSIELANRIDASIIGGIKVVIGDKVYDDTLKNKLNSLKTLLLEKKGD